MTRKLRVRHYDPYQRLIVPLDITHLLPENNLARYVADVTSHLDLSSIESFYENESGEEGFHPRMMLNLIFYAYATGTYSSRGIESKTYTDIAYRFLAASEHPDHSTIARFRVRFLEELKDLFAQIVMMCRKGGLVKLGKIAIDGTKIKANASIRNTKNYKAIKKEYDELKKEMDKLLRKGTDKDSEEDNKYGKDKRGDELPEGFADKKRRFETLKQIKKEMEKDEKLISDEHNKKIQEREEEERRTGKKKRGRKPIPKEDIPDEKYRHNFTDPDSKMMKDNGTNSIVQGYNCQNAVDLASQVVLSCHVTQDENDKHQALPMVQMLVESFGITDPKELQKMLLTLDAGYFTEDELIKIMDMKIDLYISPDGYNSNPQLPKMRGRIPKDMSLKDRMRRKIRTKKGKKTYGKRKIVEAPFGWIKEARGFRRFSLRGLKKVDSEWTLINLTHNILVMHRKGVVL